MSDWADELAARILQRALDNATERLGLHIPTDAIDANARHRDAHQIGELIREAFAEREAELLDVLSCIVAKYDEWLNAPADLGSHQVDLAVDAARDLLRKFGRLK